ncbi:MAG: alanine racemase [Bacillota bacterium]|nr:alanine racemase [Bacillota bacterium]
MYTSIENKDKLNRDLWIEVDLEAIAHNMRVVRKLARSPIVSAVVKADGYGHGAVAVGRTLLENGADRFAVATADEAYELRDAFPDVPILILGEVEVHLAPVLAEKKIAVTVTTPQKLARFAEALCADASRASAYAYANPLIVHIKVDTGMGRIGCEPTEEMAAEWEAVAGIAVRSHVEIEGIFSHFAKADDADKRFSHLQAKRFTAFVEMLKDRGIEPPIKHMANSAAVMELPEYHFDMVRAGILIFGMTPTGEKLPELRPALSIKSRAIFVKTIPEDMGIGYSHSYTARKGSRIVTVPAGYADGISRLLSNKMDVLIGGKRCRQVGNICMDHLMVLGHEDVQAGDEIVIAGYQEVPGFPGHGECIAIEELAREMGTLNYEIICMLSKRIPRVYIKRQHA